MAVWQAIILGFVQGIAEFLPISSSGHLVLLSQVMGLKSGDGMLLEALLHVGTLFSIFLVFRSDIKRMFWELIHIIGDLFENLKIYFINKKLQEPQRYRKLLGTNYRKFTVLVLVSTIPTAVIGYLIQGMVDAAAENLLAPAIGFFITAVLLLVTEHAPEDREKTPKDTKWAEAAVLGIFQGLAVFPGISRAGATLSAGFLCGFSRKYAIKYSYLMAIPAIIGAVILELQGVQSEVSAGEIGVCILAMMIAAVVGVFGIKITLAVIRKNRLRLFSLYCMLIGIVCAAVYFTRQ